ncbi:MAG: sirohydrochlorin chelatase [Arachnia sp.]
MSALVRRMRAFRPDLAVHACRYGAEPSLVQAAALLVAEGAREIVAVPLDLVAATEPHPELLSQLSAVTTEHPEVRIIAARPLGPAAEFLSVLDSKVRDALHRAEALEVDALVLATPEGADPRGLSLLARRARQWSAHHRLPVRLATMDTAGAASAAAVTALRAQGRRHIAVGALCLEPTPDFVALQQAASRAGALAVTEPLLDDPQVLELILARYAFAAMELLDDAALGADLILLREEETSA